MRLLLVEVTRADSGWKGTWYRTGQRHFAIVEPYWPQVCATKYRAINLAGGIMESDCKVLTDPLSRIKCFLRGLWKTEWQRQVAAMEKVSAEMAAGDPDSTWGKGQRVEPS